MRTNLPVTQREYQSTGDETLLFATTHQNFDTAQLASQLANAATEIATKLGDAVANVVATMALISESSSRIADIIRVIDAIAFQANILSLNAPAETASAGEQGRRLAGRSAAKEIMGLIDDSVEKVESGSRLVADVGQTMTKVLSQVRLVNDLMAEITAASNELSKELIEIVKPR